MNFDDMKLPELKAEAKKLKIKGFSTMRKAQLVSVLKAHAKPKSSLGPIPFKLVKEFMLEKPKKYFLEEDQEIEGVAELYHYTIQFEMLKEAVEVNTPKKKRKIFMEHIDYVLKLIQRVIKYIDKDFNFLKDEKMMKKIKELVENREDEDENPSGTKWIQVGPHKLEQPEWFEKWGFDVDYADVDEGDDEDTYYKMNGVKETFKDDAKDEVKKDLDSFKSSKKERDDDAKDEVKAKVAARDKYAKIPRGSGNYYSL